MSTTSDATEGWAASGKVHLDLGERRSRRDVRRALSQRAASRHVRGRGCGRGEGGEMRRRGGGASGK
eukprot:236601-Rhodomonas_salina.1